MAKEGIKLGTNEKSAGRVEELNPGSTMTSKGPNKLLPDDVEKKYQGEFVALCTGREKKVVAHEVEEGKFVALSAGREKKVLAHADTYEALLKAVKKIPPHILFSIISVPREGALYSH